MFRVSHYRLALFITDDLWACGRYLVALIQISRAPGIEKRIVLVSAYLKRGISQL